jgi:hypothetical protein
VGAFEALDVLLLSGAGFCTLSTTFPATTARVSLGVLQAGVAGNAVEGEGAIDNFEGCDCGKFFSEEALLTSASGASFVCPEEILVESLPSDAAPNPSDKSFSAISPVVYTLSIRSTVWCSSL